jgi:propionyl-CoA carboxylase alpha chain
VAVYSESDFRSLHVTHADEAVELGGARPSESYLNKEKIIATALETGCQAIHPGYGFLSENAAFAEMVAAAGLTFIGPPAPVIAALGDKIAAKKLAHEAGVPTVPGHMMPVRSRDEAVGVAEEVGYPVLLKPAAGGGGKGMRIVERSEDLASALSMCQQETRKAFGDDSIFIERCIQRPRHIEIQVMADHHGNVVHLGERECSIQRRYQKIIEESPSVAIDDTVRQRMGAMACDLARQAGYRNAGTVEFIMDQSGEFFFLEMNTRLQVEHPVTEMVTSLDLVELQLRVADGEALPFSQEAVNFSGWAIEARICAEDSERGFIPSVGLVTRYAEPRGSKVRTDSGIAAGSTVEVFYDPMLAKVITWGPDREAARKKMVQALNGYHVEGIKTNIDFANRVITHPAFVSGDLSTDFIAEHLLDENQRLDPPLDRLHFMAIATTLIYSYRENLIRDSLLPLTPRVGSATQPLRRSDYVAKSDGDLFKIQLQKSASEFDWQIQVDDRVYHVTTPPPEFYRRRLKLTINGEIHYFRLRYSGNFTEVAFCGLIRTFEIYDPREWELAQYMPPPVVKQVENVLQCPMPGLIVEVKVQPGDRVFRGQELVIIESMKMESAVASSCDGVVESIEVKPEDAVDTGMVLVTFKG